MINLSSIHLVVLPLALVLVGVNIYFRMRIMNGFKDLHKKGVQLNPTDMMTSEARKTLVTSRYPEHKEEINQLAKYLRLSLKMIVATVVFMLFIFLFTYFKNS